jgi:hypothetical protein
MRLDLQVVQVASEFLPALQDRPFSVLAVVVVVLRAKQRQQQYLPVQVATVAAVRVQIQQRVL